MPIFPSAQAAYCWAYEILDVWRNGSAFDPDPELYRGNTGALGAVHMAMDIEWMAQAACAVSLQRCRWQDKDCFMRSYMPPPTEPAEERTDQQMQQIKACASVFESMLRQVGWVD